MKNRRQDKILELISKYDIETQDNLIERLQAAGSCPALSFCRQDQGEGMADAAGSAGSFARQSIT